MIAAARREPHPWPFPSSSARFNDGSKATVTIAFANPQPVGILLSAAMNGPIGPFIDVSVEGKQAGAGGTLDATLSIALHVWDA